ncbi:hypothetical protein FKW77_006170 [Venturia effusa]|uniref:Shugoshin C-terminal domain-containing protein n=1 Tax=Venturia effusa TaxID=50376 RepID=A0A517LLL9_9PEZI|nr:hypothetical protein FKW77_006170 [Venturia effusa]
MARLASAPDECVDALKRRFLRQNRELAKTNSTQSVRIRCLEAEVSRLLTENLHLREEILQWRNSVERGPDRYAVVAVKNEFEAKIRELGKLVADLGSLTQSQPQEKGDAREPTVGWGRGGNVELGDGSDGRLPAILEDKAWGRKTLDSGEILALAESAESPDLGPPPVAQFQDEDPIQFDAQPMVTKSEPEMESQPEAETLPEELPAALSVNLETRRKRRDSHGKLNIRRMSGFHSPPEQTEDDRTTGAKAIGEALPVRAGAKRKISARDDEAKGPDDFLFIRRASVAFEDPAKIDKEKPAREDSRPRSKHESSAILPSGRKALGTKPVNTDPMVSPKKPTVKARTLDEKPQPKKTSEHGPKDPPRPRSRQSIKPKAEKQPIISLPPAHIVIPEVVEIQPTDLLSKTPAASGDLFSPVTTEPPTSRPQAGRDTPPPSDLGAASDGNAGRAGRRARTSVNYAEPSLHSKMRRPSAQLVDAVDSRGRPVPGIMVPSAAAKEKSLTASLVKAEPKNEDEWKLLPGAGEPASPLSKKSTGLSAPLAPISGNGEETRENVDRPVQSAAAAAISTLIQSNKERRKSQGIVFAPTEHEEKKKERDSLGVFDFVSSSPPRDHVSVKTTERPRTASRRHSAVPGSSNGSAVRERVDEQSRPDSRTGHKRISSANVPGGRPGATARSLSTEGDDEGVGLARSQRASRRSSMLG